MKSKILAISVLLLSQSLLAETYVCSHELSRYGRSGEVEMLTYIRDGNSFIRNWENIMKDRYLIQSESDEMLILNRVDDSKHGINLAIINKKTKEFGGAAISLDNFKNYDSPYRDFYGKCKVLK